MENEFETTGERKYIAVQFCLSGHTTDELNKLVAGFFPAGEPVVGQDYVLRCTAVESEDDAAVVVNFAIVPK